MIGAIKVKDGIALRPECVAIKTEAPDTFGEIFRGLFAARHRSTAVPSTARIRLVQPAGKPTHREIAASEYGE